MEGDSPEPGLHLSEHSELYSSLADFGPLQLRVPFPDRGNGWPLPVRTHGKASSRTGAHRRRSGGRSSIATPQPGAGVRPISDLDRSVDCDAPAVLAASRLAHRGVSQARAGLGIAWNIQRERSARSEAGFHLRYAEQLELSSALRARPDPVRPRRPSFDPAAEDRPAGNENRPGGHDEAFEGAEHHAGGRADHGPADDAGGRQGTD